MNKQQLFIQAHQIAAEAKAEGYDYRASFQQALIDLYAATCYAVVKLNFWASAGKTWVAFILGTCKKYRFNRQFVQSAASDRSGSGKTGQEIFHLADGLYETSEGYRGRSFIIVSAGHAETISAERAAELAAAM